MNEPDQKLKGAMQFRPSFPDRAAGCNNCFDYPVERRCKERDLCGRPTGGGSWMSSGRSSVIADEKQGAGWISVLLHMNETTHTAIATHIIKRAVLMAEAEERRNYLKLLEGLNEIMDKDVIGIRSICLEEPCLTSQSHSRWGCKFMLTPAVLLGKMTFGNSSYNICADDSMRLNVQNASLSSMELHNLIYNE